MLLLALPLTGRVGQDQKAPPARFEPAPAPVGPPPELAPEQRVRANELSASIRTLREGAKFAEAIPLAEELHALFAEQRGIWVSPDGQAEWWEAGNARREVATLRTIAALSLEEQAALARCGGLEAELDRAYLDRDYRRAAEIAEEQLEVRAAALGVDHPEALRSLNDLGLFRHYEGRAEEAEALYREAHAGLRAVLGDWHPDTTTSLLGLASILLEVRGELDAAEPLLQEVVRIRRTLLPIASQQVAWAVSSLGGLATGKGDLVAAAAHYGEALTTLTTLRGEGDADVAWIRGNLARVYSSQGTYGKAETLLRVELDALRAVGSDNLQTARCLWSLGSVTQLQGRYDEAEPLYREALTLARRLASKDVALEPLVLSDLATLMTAKGNAVEAETLQREALDLRRGTLGARHPNVGVSLNNLALMLRDKGDLAEAETLMRESLAIRREKLGATHPDVAFCLANLAQILRSAGDELQAEQLLREALASLRQWPHEGRQLAYVLDRLALLLAETERLEEAEALARQAVAEDLRALGEAHPGRSTALVGLAQILAARGDPEAAEPFAREAFALRERARTRVIGTEHERAAFAAQMNLRNAAAIHAAILLRLGSTSQAYEVEERSRARALLDLMARDDREVLTAAREALDPEALERLTRALTAEDVARIAVSTSEARIQTTRERKDISADESARMCDEFLAGLGHERRVLGDASAAVQIELHGLYPEGQPACLEAIRAGLRADELLLSFSWSEHALVLYCVAPRTSETDGLPAVDGLLLADGEAASRLAADLLATRAWAALEAQSAEPRAAGIAADSASSSGTHGVEASARVFQSLFPPRVWDRVRSARRIVVVPDGPLSLLPLEALVVTPGRGPEERRFFLDVGPEVVYAPSASLYVGRITRRDAQLARAPQGAPTALVLGAPTFTRARTEGATTAETRRGERDLRAEATALDQIRLFGGSLAVLPGTGSEARTIAGAFTQHGGAAELLVGDDATIARLVAGVAGKRFVHFATHGLMGNSARPFEASLALAQPSVATPDDTGFLRLADLLGSWRGRLDECELVVLSACDTQRGAVVGDTQFSLPVGFFFAGAPSVVASLWPVDDRSTAELMSAFYGRLLEKPGEDKLTAFTQARRGLRARDPNPFSWAPFVYLGAPR